MASIKDVSWDLSLRRTIPTRDGRQVTALEVQWQLLEAAQKYERERGLESVGEEVGIEVLHRWEQVLTALEGDRSLLANQLDWVAKERLFDGYMDRHGIDWTDARCGRSTSSTTTSGPTSRSSPAWAWTGWSATTRSCAATTEPPESTRAYFRGRVPAEVARRHRGRELGFAGVRHRVRPAPAGADDGTAAWNGGPCG